MKKTVAAVFLLIVSVITCPFIKSQSEDSVRQIQLSLKNVVDLAVTKSSAVKYAQNQNQNYYWRFKNYQARFRPQLTLNGDLPDYENTTARVQQEDGSIKFLQVSSLQTSANVSLNQSIPQLGTYVWASSSLERFQDFIGDTSSFSGSPFSIGFTQPVFSYNWMKWYRKSEPLVYEEANRDYVQSIEEIALHATQRFFRYLMVQTNFNLAKSNLKNSEDNMKIAEMKKKLGKISENDYSRIKLSVFNARKSLNRARMDLKNADFDLKSYTGIDQSENIDLEMPLNITFFKIDKEKAIEEAKANRKETPHFKRRLLEADRQLAEAKSNNGLSATLRGSYGVSKSDHYWDGVYDHPKQSKIVKLTLSVPILDWGKSASQVKLAESKRDLEIFDVNKAREDFERSVAVQVEQFKLLKDQLTTAREADKVAGNGYKIAIRKFQNGEISITDLNISLSERESAKRDYINSLRDYWEAFYNLRILTLYDFQANQKITYQNPLLGNK
ncbi:MAG TPA: TolC family protein [Bacteroidales bacterium]|nr:TolC family protein [Bacteroidales bacterium]